MSSADARDLANQAMSNAADAQDLMRALQAAGASGKDLQTIDEVAKALREMGKESAYKDPQGMQQLMQTTLDKMKKFEFDMRKKLDTTNDQLFLSGAEEVPSNFQGLVQEYSRALGKNGAAPAKSQTKPTTTTPPAKPGRGGGL
jgi:aspartate/methionine/tyrosine aminotransferase